MLLTIEMIGYSATISIVLHRLAIFQWHGAINPHSEVMLPSAPFRNLTKRNCTQKENCVGSKILTAVTMKSYIF
jgi:hypothetical protein